MTTTVPAATAAPALVPRPRPSLRARLSKPRVRGWIFLLPLIVVNAVVVIVPSLFAVYYSFTDWSGIGPATFTGLTNYRDLLADDEFLNGLWHNIIWTV